MTDRPLTTKQRLFVEAYLANPNATEAAIRAGDDASIYGIFAEGECFYIGSTVTSLERRFNQHLRNVRLKRHINRRFMERVISVGAANCSIHLLATASVEDRFIVEYEWIERTDGLTNIVGSLRQQDRLRAISANKHQHYADVFMTATRRIASAYLCAKLFGNTKKYQLSKELLIAVWRDDADGWRQAVGSEAYERSVEYGRTLGIYNHFVN